MPAVRVHQGGRSLTLFPQTGARNADPTVAVVNPVLDPIFTALDDPARMARGVFRRALDRLRQALRTQ